MKPVQIARAPFTDAVFVCRKCARKAGAKQFRKDLKQAFKESGARRVRIVETSCLDLCPKKRVVVAYGAQLARRRVLVVAPDGAAHAAAAITAEVMSGSEPQRRLPAIGGSALSAGLQRHEMPGEYRRGGGLAGR